MPFGMSFDEFKRTARAAQSGDQAAADRLRAGSGTHVFGHKVDAKKLLVGAAVVGGAIATGGIATGVVTLAGAAARKEPAPAPAPEETSMVPQTLSATGGSAGRSATPIIPTSSAGVVPGLVGIGLDWLRNRVNPPTASPIVATPNCPQGSRDILGRCVDLQPGGPVSGGGMNLTFGEAVMGQYGAALVPARMSTETRRCPRGTVLGKDGLCYNKRDLRKDERMWNPGRKPLLTGGELNAMSIAARAARKVKARQSQLQSMGLLARPKSRRQIELEIFAERGRKFSK